MKNLNILYFFLFFILFFIQSCTEHKIYILATGPKGTTYKTTGKNIAEFLRSEMNLSIDTIATRFKLKKKWIDLNSTNNIDLLAKKKIDFAIAQNDVPDLPDTTRYLALDNVRTILPIYTTVFFLIYKKGLNYSNINELIENKKVVMGLPNSADAIFTKNLFKEFGIDTSMYQPIYTNFENSKISDTIDVCCTITGISNKKVNEMLSNGGKLFSLGDPELIGMGSRVDGFCIKNPSSRPFIIPANLFNQYPAQPILTVAVDAVLLTHKETNDDIVYNVIKTLVEKKQIIAFKHDDTELLGINENFEQSKLHFPLHTGALQYLKRDYPSFLERYAESIALLLSLLIAFLGGAKAISNWNSLRKKNRIDSYYSKLLAIQNQIKIFTINQSKEKLQELNELRSFAFSELIKEKLVADESFRIFISLLNDVKHDLEYKIKS